MDVMEIWLSIKLSDMSNTFDAQLFDNAFIDILIIDNAIIEWLRCMACLLRLLDSCNASGTYFHAQMFCFFRAGL